MTANRRVGTAATALAFIEFLLGIAPAHADPGGCPTGATADGNGCRARLAAVTADGTNGTLTGTPVGGQVPITIFGEPQFYLPSTGFSDTPPDLVGKGMPRSRASTKPTRPILAATAPASRGHFCPDS